MTEAGKAGGIITPTSEYFQILRRICDRYQVLLIYDEIITGFGRTGSMFAAQTFGVTPDIICSGKGLSSGTLPLGAMMARSDMETVFYGPAEADLNFAHAHTFAGNPLACAVGMAVIDEIVEQGLTQKAWELGDDLAGRLEELKRYGVVREVRGKGLLQGVELVKDTQTMEPYPELGRALKRMALDNGLIIRIDPTWFALAPALIVQKADIDELCHLVENSLKDALTGLGHSGTMRPPPWSLSSSPDDAVVSLGLLICQSVRSRMALHPLQLPNCRPKPCPECFVCQNVAQSGTRRPSSGLGLSAMPCPAWVWPRSLSLPPWQGSCELGSAHPSPAACVQDPMNP